MNAQGHPERFKVVRKNERESLWFLGDNVQLILTGDDTEGRFTLAHYHAAPGSQPPLHEHLGEDEIFYMLDGEVTFWYTGGVEVTLRAGDTILLPKDVPHSFQASPVLGAKWLVMFPPSGFESFIRAIAQPAEYDAPQDGWAIDEETVEKLNVEARKAGIVLLGPPGSRPE